MFKKLKIKFIIINMTLLTLVFFTIFSSIYIINWRSMNRQMDMSLDMLMHDPQSDKRPGKIMGPNGAGNILGVIINLDSSNNVENIICPYDVDRDTFLSHVNTLIELNNDKGTIEIGGSKFAYLKSTIPKNKIVLIDMTNQLYSLMSLLKIFIIIGVLSLAVLFLISYYFASKSIQPIVETFNKQKQFIADASHELRTPLAIIKTNLSLVDSNNDCTVKSQEKWLHNIDSQTDRMSYLINDMLTLTRLDSSSVKLELVPTNINKIIENSLMSFDAVFFENGIEIQSDFTSDVVINGDNEELKKLFNILIENAIKHTPRSGRISIRISKIKNRGKIVVANTGSEIPESELPKIFERFYRADNSRARESGGYGLGLSIASSITSKLNGKIHAESNKQETSFIVEFPTVIV